MAPAEPGRLKARAVVGICGALGIGLAAWLVGLRGEGIAVAGGYLALVTLAIATLPFSGRAAALATLAGGGLFAATWLQPQTGGSAGSPGLIGVVLLWGTALQLRAWHRGSLAARVLLALGLGAGAAWLWGTDPLTVLSLPSGAANPLARILPIPFGLLLMVSMLGFMDARTTGGCGLWAVGLWLWHAAHTVARVPPWDTPAASAWMDAHAGAGLALLSTPLLLPVLSLALAQLLAGALSAVAATPPDPGATAAADNGEPV